MGFYIYLILGILFYLLFYRLTRDILNPASIFLFMWYMICAVSNLYLSDLQTPWSPLMHLATVGSGVTFSIGALLLYPTKRVQLQAKIPTTNTFRILFRAIFFLAAACFLLEWSRNGFALTVALTDDYSGDLKSSKTAMAGVHYGTILLPLCGIMAVYEWLNDGKKIFLLFIMFFVFIVYSFGFGLSRGDIFMYTVGILYMVSRYRKISLKTIFKYIGFLALTAILIMSLRVSYDSSVVYNTTDNKYVSVFYSYIALNYENLQQLISSNLGYHYAGNASLRFFWTMIGMKDSMPVTEFDTLGVFNARTYLYGFYHDYKIWGVLFFPFIIGVGIAFVYKISMWNRNNYYIILMALLQKPLFFSFFGNYFFGEMVILWPFLIAALLAHASSYKVIFKYKYRVSGTVN